MTIAQNIASKLAVAIVAIAMILLAVPSARAAEQTPEELQKTINDLLAQVAALQASAGGSSTGSSCEMIPAPLTMGATGASVTALQKRLIADGEAIAAGATGYFGAQTKAALASWQTKHNVMPAVGYYGPITKAAMDSSCTPTTTPDDNGDDNGSSSDLSGEASLDEYTLDSADDDTIQEGDEEAAIAEATFKFTDGDASISRLDVALVGSGDETDPWDTFDEVSLWVDGDKVADIDASDKDNYLDEDNGTLRFSGLDIVGMDDEDVDVTVAATVQSSVDGTADGENWTVGIDAVRFFDADGVATTEDGTVGPDDMGDTVSFTVDEAGADDELIVKSSTEDPDATTLQVEDDKKSDWYTVFAFDLDTKDSVNDITINDIKVNASTTKAAYSTLVDDAELVIDGTTIDDVTVTNGASLAIPAVLDFNVDGDAVIDAGDRVKVELKLRFKSLSSGNEGATVKGSISSLTTSIVDAEGADDLGNSQLSGAATGDAHTLRTTGIITEMTDDSAVVTAGDGSGDDYATFTLKVDVTAFEQDAYIPTNASTIDVDVISATSSVLAASPTVVLTSTGKTVNSRFEVTEGDTETLTIKVTYDPSTTNVNAGLLLKSIGFYDLSSGGTLQTQTTLPAEDYDTDIVTIVN